MQRTHEALHDTESLQLVVILLEKSLGPYYFYNRNNNIDDTIPFLIYGTYLCVSKQIDAALVAGVSQTLHHSLPHGEFQLLSSCLPVI